MSQPSRAISTSHLTDLALSRQTLRNIYFDLVISIQSAEDPSDKDSRTTRRRRRRRVVSPILRYIITVQVVFGGGKIRCPVVSIAATSLNLQHRKVFNQIQAPPTPPINSNRLEYIPIRFREPRTSSSPKSLEISTLSAFLSCLAPVTYSHFPDRLPYPFLKA